MNEYVGTNSSVVLYVDMYSRDQWFDSRWSHVLGLQCAAKEKLQCSCTGTSVRCKRETPVFMHNKHDIIFQYTGVSAAGAACCNPST